jgi:hypothetical protein
VDDLAARLEAALATGDASGLRARLTAASGLPGALDLALVQEFAAAVGAVVRRPEPPTAALVALLDGWAALTPDEAPGDDPAVILPCAAVAAYGEVAVARPEWRDDEVAKLRRAASDPRRRVREMALVRLVDLTGAGRRSR